MNMCAAFAKAGADVELLVPRRFNLLESDPFEFYSLPKTFSIRKIWAIDLYRFRWVPERISALALAFSFLFSARAVLWMKKADILFTREEAAGFFFRNYIYEVHMPEQVRRRGFAPQSFVVLTRHIKDVLVSRGIPEETILVAPDAVNLDLFKDISQEDTRKKLGFPKDVKLVLYFGNFKQWKGVDTLAEAARLMPDVFVAMIGGTKDTDIARIKEKTAGLPNVRVEGFKPQEELPYYLAAADVLILPNSGYDENSRLFTSPLKLFEYSAARRPIVASDLPSLRETLSEESAAFFESDNPSSLAETVLKVLADGSFGDRIAQKARENVEARTWDRRAEVILQFVFRT